MQNTYTAENFRKAVDRLSADKNVNIKQLCREINIDYQTVANMKRGSIRVRKEVVAAIAAIHPEFWQYLTDIKVNANPEPPRSIDDILAALDEVTQKLDVLTEDARYRDKYVELLERVAGIRSAGKEGGGELH